MIDKVFPVLKCDSAFISTIDKSTTPNIYRTNDPKYYGRLVLQFSPKGVPLLGAFSSLKELKAWVVKIFGIEQWAEWFPDGFAETLDDEQKTFVYVSEREEG